jgi:hypothetical protein
MSNVVVAVIVIVVGVMIMTPFWPLSVCAPIGNTFQFNVFSTLHCETSSRMFECDKSSVS